MAGVGVGARSRLDRVGLNREGLSTTFFLKSWGTTDSVDNRVGLNQVV